MKTNIKEKTKKESIEVLAKKFMELDDCSKNFIAGYMSARIEVAEEIRQLREKLKQ